MKKKQNTLDTNTYFKTTKKVPFGKVRKEIINVKGTHATPQLYLCRKIRLSHVSWIWHQKHLLLRLIIMLELWGMQNTSLLLSLPGLLSPRSVTPDKLLSMGQIELNCVLRLKWIVWKGTVYMHKVKTANVVDGGPKAFFLIATTPKSGRGQYSFPWIAPLYPWSMHYNGEC